MHKGVNLSHSSSVDYAMLAKNEIDFALIRATTETNEVDPLAQRHLAGCREQGMKVGLYHLHVPQIGPEADTFPEFFNFFHASGPLDFPPALAVSMEDPEGWGHLADSTVEWCRSITTWNLGDHRKPLYGCNEEFAKELEPHGWPWGYKTWGGDGCLIHNDSGFEWFTGDEDEWEALVGG